MTQSQPEAKPEAKPESHAPASAPPALAELIDERANHCFVCGPENPQGLHLKFQIDAEALTATSQVNLTRLHEGPPGHIHGGIIATLMDEAMGKLGVPLDAIMMTRNMVVDYLRPSPLGVELTLTGRFVRREGRKVFLAAELRHPSGSVLATATGLFIVIDPALLGR